MNEREHAGGPAIPSPEQARQWLLKHLAKAPERDERWYREVLDIYRAGKRDSVAEQPPKRVA